MSNTKKQNNDLMKLVQGTIKKNSENIEKQKKDREAMLLTKFGFRKK